MADARYLQELRPANNFLQDGGGLISPDCVFGRPGFCWENATRWSRATAPADLEPPKGLGFGLGFGLYRAKVRSGVGLVRAGVKG